MNKSDIVDSVKRCIHISEEGVLAERCDGCPLRRGEYEDNGYAACGPFENLSVSMPYELVEMMLILIEGQESKKPAECETARVLAEKEVRLLEFGTHNWMEFKISGGRTELCNPILLKGHRTEKRMLEYGITWRVWSEKPTYKQRIERKWKPEEGDQ